MPCRATQDGWVMVESSEKMWSTGEGNGKPLQYSCHENPMNSMKRQKDMTLKYAIPRSVDTQHATGEEWRNNSKKNEEAEPKQKQHPNVEVTGDGREVKSDAVKSNLLGRKAMIDLDSILKSRDITLLTKVHLVKAVIFPVVMYRCESWTIKKAEC